MCEQTCLFQASRSENVRRRNVIVQARPCCHLQGAILLLVGPSGCGKTATVQVLSGELGFRVQEWTNPTNLEPYGSWQNGDHTHIL